MVYCLSVHHTIYGVIRMTQAFIPSRRNSSKEHTGILNFLLFLTGALLGCLCVKFLGIQNTALTGVSAANQAADGSGTLAASFPAVLLANGKLLVLLYLFAFLRCGAALIPPLFGAEGAFLGAAFASAILSAGVHGAVRMALLLIFRLLLILPYGFLLGEWAVSHSLSLSAGGTRREACFRILLLTLLVLLLASFLECTLGSWLGGIYLLKFGV